MCDEPGRHVGGAGLCWTSEAERKRTGNQFTKAKAQLEQGRGDGTGGRLSPGKSQKGFLCCAKHIPG